MREKLKSKNNIHAKQITAASHSGHIQGNRNTTYNNGVDSSVINRLIKTQQLQIKFLQDALKQSNERNRELTKDISLGKKTLEVTLVNLTKTCEECYNQHRYAQRKLDKLAGKLK